MKYVMIVLYLAVVGGETQRTEFTLEFDDRASCLAALEETEAKVMARVETRALSIECRPRTMFDEPIAWNEFMSDVHRYASAGSK